MIIERHAKTTANKDPLPILQRALLDLEDACVNMREALKIIPNDTRSSYVTFYEVEMEMVKLSGNLEGRIRYYKRIVAESAYE